MDINEALKDFIGTNMGPETKQKLKQAVEDSLSYQESAEVMRVGTRWERFSRKQKIIWYLCNEIFKFIGNRARKRHRDFVSTLSEDERDIYFRGGEDSSLPYWAISAPKSIIVMDVSVKLSEPLEFINVDLK